MGTRFFILLVVHALLFIHSMPVGFGGRRGADGLFPGARDSSTMEEIWSNCKMDFSGIQYVMRGADLLIPVDIAGYSPTLNLEKFSFLGEDLQETFSHLPAEMKHSLIVCLINQNFLVPVYGGPSPKNGYFRHMTRFLDQVPVLRRLLAGQPVNENLHVSAAALTPHRRTQASKTSLAPAPTPALAPLNRVNNNPQPSSSASVPAANPHEFAATPLPGLEVINRVPSSAVAPSEQKSNNKKTIIIAVVVTATVTFTLSALCFCCLYRHLRRNYQSDNGQRDDRPLLSLSLSDFSGSSHVSFGLANSGHKDKNDALSFKANPNQNGQVGPFYRLSELQVDEVHSSVSSSTEPTNAPSNPPAPAPPPPPPPPLMPPGRLVASPPAPPPLPNTMPAAPLPKAKLPPLKKEPPAPKGGTPSPNTTPPPKGGPPPNAPPPPKYSPPPPKVPSRPPQANLISSASSLPVPNISTNAFNNDSAKAKLKPFFWDKVMANPNQSMVWHEIKSGSFQFNEEMIETLFGYSTNDKRRNDAKWDLRNDPSSQHIQILDPKKSHNLAISIKAQNVKVEEVCDALMEGNELPIELLQTLLRMAPTTDEELKLSRFNDNTALLGPAEQFVKAIINIPFAFKRMETLLLMTTLQEESTFVKESFATLEEACKELRNSRLFLKLLEAVLKTGNRMNDGTYRGGAQAFKLDTLLKLSDVKGADGKTTLLHFVVQEIIRSEGRRAVRVARENSSNSSITISNFNSEDSVEDVPEESEDQYRTLGLRTVSGLSSELENVKKAAGLDADALTGAVANMGHRLAKAKEFLNTDMRKLEEMSRFHDSLNAFVEHAEVDIAFLLEEEKRIRLLVKNTTDYFYGNAGREEGLRLFVIVRDFLGMLNKACEVVRFAQNKGMKIQRNKDNPALQPIPEPRQLLFPSIKDQHVDDFSSDDEGS